MKEVVLYYSLSGVTKKVAQAIASKRNCDIIEIEMIEPYTKSTAFSKGVVETKKGVSPAIKELPSLEQYGRIWLGTPIWAFGYAAPLNVVFEQGMLEKKEVFLFSTSAGLAGSGSLKGIKDKLSKSNVIGSKNFSMADVKKQSSVSDWIGTIKL